MTFCGDFNVSRPQQRYRSPRLRQAAATLAASGESAVEIDSECLTTRHISTMSVEFAAEK